MSTADVTISYNYLKLEKKANACGLTIEIKQGKFEIYIGKTVPPTFETLWEMELFIQGYEARHKEAMK